MQRAVLCAALAMAAACGALAAPTETVLHSFCSLPSCSDGGGPRAGVIADSSGNLYGTTEIGGAASGCVAGGGCGTVFKLSPGGTETVLHSFTGSDGAFPFAGLIADSAGNLYGTTRLGGASGNGVVFKLSPGGTLTVLHSFTGIDGRAPQAGLIADSSGNLYGTTTTDALAGFGVVFKLSPGGTLTVLHSFTGSDGSSPVADLIADSAGNLYGTTLSGGAAGQGVVFKLSPGGTETVLHSFTGGSDGGSPPAGLITDSAGNLYGTTLTGGAAGFGVVFKLSPGGTETVLYSFTGGSDGANPDAGLIADNAGNLYGTTQTGGASNNGVVFKLSPGGTETVLHSFTGSDGRLPEADLIADSAGNLYGTTGNGGASNFGTVFKLAGTGFCTVPFSAFSAKLAIDLEQNPNHDALGLLASFTLGSASDGINPVTEPVTLEIGSFTAAIPPGSFTQSPLGTYTFIGMINGVDMEVVIQPTGGKQFAVEAAALNANLAGTANPVTVRLSIGDDCGTAPVNADIF